MSLIYIPIQILFKEHKGYLADFINLGKDKEIPVVIMNIPAITNFDNYPYQFVNDYVENVARSNGALYLDMLTELSKYDSNDLMVSFIDGHLNELGNDITANTLFDFLENNELLMIMDQRII